MNTDPTNPGLVLVALGLLRQEAAAGAIAAADVHDSLVVVREALRLADVEPDARIRAAIVAACKEINAACRAALALFEARHAQRH